MMLRATLARIAHPRVADPVILLFDLAWTIPLFLIPPESFTVLGTRFFVLLGVKGVWVGMGVVATAAKSARWFLPRGALWAGMAWVSVCFWSFLSVLLFWLVPVAPFWPMAFVVCLICWDTAIFSTFWSYRSVAQGSTLDAPGG